MDQSQSKSVVIVGGGIIGLACAHYLSDAGFAVTILERGKIAAECSHGNCGYICPSHIPPLTEPGAFKVAIKSLFNPKSPFRVKPSLNPALLQWMFQFAVRCRTSQVISAGQALQAILDSSIDEYRKLMATYSLRCDWEEKGLLYVFKNEGPYKEFAEMDHFLKEHFGLAATTISGKELADFDPGLRPNLHGGFHYPGDASVRPDLLNQQWTELLRQRGVVFHEETELISIRSTSGKIASITTNQSEFNADHFVFAMGALSSIWSKQLGIKIPIQPGKGYSVTLPRPTNCPTYPILFPEEKVGVSPFSEGMRLGSMMEFVGYDTSIPQTRIQQLRDAARKYLIASVDAPAQEEWFGWRPMTWDSLPIIGRIPGLANGVLATGHNMIGLTLAPATGRLVSEILCGTPTHIDIAPYNPMRF